MKAVEKRASQRLTLRFHRAVRVRGLLPHKPNVHHEILGKRDEDIRVIGTASFLLAAPEVAVEVFMFDQL